MTQNGIKRIRILTVGDGDLTLSLAIVRAYGENSVSVTASVLDSKEDMLSAFPDAPLEELAERKISVLFGADATQLHRNMTQRWDIVIFHHPHLGLVSLNQDEADHANRHYQLLCHYFYSASKVAKFVHVCLCGTQRTTWNLDGAAKRQRLTLKQELSTAVPFAQLWSDDAVSPTVARPEYAAPRKYRFGKLGSRHFLGKYGYCHRRTAGERYRGGSLDMNVTGSMHYVFELADGHPAVPESDPASDYGCSVCGSHFESGHKLELHLAAPALPRGAELSNDACALKMPDAPAPGEKIGTGGGDSTFNHRLSFTVDRPTGAKESETIVPREDDGKRLRWFLKTKTKLSKSKGDAAVRSGRVLVDGTQVLDTSRILKAGMSVVVFAAVEPTGAVGSHNSGSNTVESVTVVHRCDPFVVVEKPSGMRTKGAIPGSLEFVLSRQEGISCECLSRLDTSTAGLCGLIPKTTYLTLERPPDITHSMLALLHGRVPDDWSPCYEYSSTMSRKWKKRKHSTSDGRVSGDATVPAATAAASSTGVKILPLQRSGVSSGIYLSTVCIETVFPSAATVCHMMRKLGYPVVGDTNCRREYLELKRSIRNRIKNRICLVSYQVSFKDFNSDTTIQVPRTLPPIPDKLSAEHWETNFGSGGASTVE